jgi:hypothetical protein
VEGLAETKLGGALLDMIGRVYREKGRAQMNLLHYCEAKVERMVTQVHLTLTFTLTYILTYTQTYSLYTHLLMQTIHSLTNTHTYTLTYTDVSRPSHSRIHDEYGLRYVA